MKICPVCNDSFPDELNFCDIDGSQLGRDTSQANGAHGKDRGNNWWSLLGAGLLVGAVVISAASIIFLPKARVALPVVSSEPQSLPAAPKASSTDAAVSDSSATVAAAGSTSEPDPSAADVVAPEPRKRDKSAANSNGDPAAPNPKAAALAAEGVDSAASARDANKNGASAANKSETPPALKPVSDTRAAETATKPAQAPVDVKKDQRPAPAVAKSSDKGSDKKKSDDKDKKKGGFLRVFKKIFGKD